MPKGVINNASRSSDERRWSSALEVNDNKTPLKEWQPEDRILRDGMKEDGRVARDLCLNKG